MSRLDICNPFNAAGSPVYYEETVSSTMDVSRLLALQGEPHGTVIAADFQEAGRGRGKGRLWLSDRKMNLAFTVLLRYPGIEDIPPALTLRAGLAVSLALEDFAPSLQGLVLVKWPNDIMIGAKKAAGILCEVCGGDVHLGVGINVWQREFPAHLKEKAASIALAINKDQSAFDDRFFLLEKILARLFSGLETPAGLDWKPSLEQRLYKKGCQVVFMDGAADSGKEVRGCLAGVTDAGELIISVDGENKRRSFITGELFF